MQVTAAGARGTLTGATVSSSSSSASTLLSTHSLCAPSTAQRSLFAPSVSRSQTSAPMPFDLFQPYIGARNVPIPSPAACQPGLSVIGRLTTTAVDEALLPGRLGLDVRPPIYPTYLPPALGGAGPAAAAAAAAAAIWTKHWQKSHESRTTLIHPFAAASALW